RYVHEIVGLKERMTEIEAAIGRVQLRRLPAWTETRIANANRITEALSESVMTPKTAPGATHVFHQYTIRSTKREAIMAAMQAAEIGFGIYYPGGTHVQAPYRQAAHASMPVTERVSAEVLSIPTRPDLAEAEIELIVQTVVGAVT
ncbi:MAG: DegT/DnrJ/EryC1/StrS family aminotransferase, partial [Acidimicrobiales bacterium]